MRIIFLLVVFVLGASSNVFAKTVHIVVPLCDNIHQRIVPVSWALGNGNKPDSNLYWGAMYGVKGWFKRQPDWQIISESKSEESPVMARMIIKHKTLDLWIVADAYKGSKIKTAVKDFLNYAAGLNPAEIKASEKTLHIGGDADLIVYAGHNGLMDFDVTAPAIKSAKPSMVFACLSKQYFLDILGQPLLLTTGRMAPESYAIDAAVTAWAKNENIKTDAGNAYAKYQKINPKAGLGLFYVPN